MNDHLDNARRKVLITGAGSGIGEATARRFAAENWDVYLNGREEEKLREVLEKLPEGDHLVCAADYSDPKQMEQIASSIGQRWGRLDAMVNSAGISREVDAIETPLDEWRYAMDMMITGAVNATRLAVPLMKSGGRIIHITSVHGQVAWANTSSYAMAKAAINQYCRNLAVDLAARGILVNAIAPGFIDTPMSRAEGVNELESDWFRENYIDGHHLPLRRAGQPGEIAGVVYFLAGPDATYLTGQVITVDGGLTITA